MTYELPKLPYDYNALEPYIDAKTMEIHHTKHHQAYITNLNTVLEKYPSLADEKLEDLLRNLDSQTFEEKDKIFFRNNAGGHVSHSLFWTIMDPQKNSRYRSQSRGREDIWFFGRVQNSIYGICHKTIRQWMGVACQG